MPALNIAKSWKYLLTAIVPCITNGKDTTQELTMYSCMSFPIIIDLQVIGCIVGCIKRGTLWGIMDMSSDLARMAVVDLAEDD